jgi:N-acyl-D-aspartate/D-glutamate deacylase
MYDVLIKGGTIVDGSGGDSYLGDVGIAQGRVVAVGHADGQAGQIVDAAGLIVAPGFVDIHTHYDAQVWWDPTLSPSSLHGVTTAIAGNCGFTLAPLGDDYAEYLMSLMARVEGIPISALRQGLPWDWTSAAEWMARLSGRSVVNMGFFAGHSALRLASMGMSAVGERATRSQLEAMKAHLREALDAGAIGFSSSLAANHRDANGDPVPSRAADVEELVALSGVLRDYPGTTVAFIPTRPGSLPEADVDLMVAMTRAAGRSLNWNVLTIVNAAGSNHERRLAAGDRAAKRGGHIVALTLPGVTRLRLNFSTGFVLDSVPGWSDLFAAPMADRLKMLESDHVRERLREGAMAPHLKQTSSLFSWDDMVLVDSPSSDATLVGHTLAEVANRRRRSVLDALFDIVGADHFRTALLAPPKGDDDATWSLRAEVWRDERSILGGSDAGAHGDMMCGAAFTTGLLGPGVRERGLLTIEEAVHQLTEVPSRYLGLRDRGRLCPGWWGDVTVFDPDRVGPGVTEARTDLPGGAMRLFVEAQGVEHVFVNGQPIVRDGSLTGAVPGRILRAGVDTQRPSAVAP